MSVKRCQQEVDGPEFCEWMAYDRIDPIGDARADLRAAMQCALHANINRDTKKRPKPFGVDEFMPFKDEPKPEPRQQTEEEQMGPIKALANMGFGKMDKDK